MCSQHSHTALSSGNEGWPWTRNVIFVNVTVVRARTQAGLALLPPPVPGQPQPLLPAAPLCICRSRAGLSSSESTKQHEVLHHILQVTSKPSLPIMPPSCCLVGGQLPHTLPGRVWAAAMLESWLQHPQLARECREVLALIYQFSTKPGRNDEQVPPTVSGHGWRWGPAPIEGRQEPPPSILGTARLSPLGAPTDPWQLRKCSTLPLPLPRALPCAAGTGMSWGRGREETRESW